MSNPSITADKTPWYQWDTGLTVTVSGGEMTECHFANRKQGTAYVQAVINGVARVPDELLQVAAPIKAYGYVSDGAGGQTYIEETFEVIARNIPSDYTYTKTAQKTIRDAEVARDQAVQAAKDAKASELAADDSAVEASTSAQSAGESASAAATSASNAAKSAGDAATSASDAKAAADKAVEDASAQLKTYTDNAKTSADSAATSASNAADAASAASGSASAAEQSATDASNAKAAAQTAKAEAETSASNAATSASNAASSATAAANSASDAAASVDAINVIAPKTVDTAAVSNFASIAIGNNATCNAGYSLAIGESAHAFNLGTVSIGSNAGDIDGLGNSNVAVGDNATVDGKSDHSVAIGSWSNASKANEFSIGNDTLTREITHVSSPTADTSASTKKYTDDNDAKTLSEANKYTDANTSNALVGTVSGKLLHVEDAWPSKPLGLTIDGAYKQDGTPSPEAPVPIEVIENPVVKVTGMNMFDISKLQTNFNDPYGLKISVEDGYIIIQGTVSGAGNNTTSFLIGWYADNSISGKGLSISLFGAPSNVKAYGLRTADETQIAVSTSLMNGDKVDWKMKIVVSKGEPKEYKPYTSQSLPITLPAEHPYLAALPDGTHDEIVIDKDGNASLVARVQKVSLNDWRSSSGNYYAHNMPSNWVTASGITSIGIAASQSSDDAGKIWFGTARFIVAYTPRDGDTIESINALGILGYFSQDPVTYQLGKLDMPALPETISNVLIEDSLTPNTTMTYKRDINIAFENLAQAVVAAAAGE